MFCERFIYQNIFLKTFRAKELSCRTFRAKTEMQTTNFFVQSLTKKVFETIISDSDFYDEVFVQRRVQRKTTFSGHYTTSRHRLERQETQRKWYLPFWNKGNPKEPTKKNLYKKRAVCGSRRKRIHLKLVLLSTSI